MPATSKVELYVAFRRDAARLCAAIVDRLTFGGDIICDRHRLLPPCPHPSARRRP